MTLKNIFDRICEVDQKAQALASSSLFESGMGFLTPVCPDPDHPDPDDLFMKHSLENIMELLYDVHDELSYLKNPVHGEFTLERFPSGKVGYIDDQGNKHEFNTWSSLEAKVPDNTGASRWVRTCICHDGMEYFLWKHESLPLPGLTVRERW